MTTVKKYLMKSLKDNKNNFYSFEVYLHFSKNIQLRFELPEHKKFIYKYFGNEKIKEVSEDNCWGKITVDIFVNVKNLNKLNDKVNYQEVFFGVLYKKMKEKYPDSHNEIKELVRNVHNSCKTQSDYKFACEYFDRAINEKLKEKEKLYGRQQKNN